MTTETTSQPIDFKAWLKTKEGYETKPYKGEDGIWTVGVGSTTDVDPNKIISDNEVEKRLDKDIVVAENDYKRLVNKDIDADLTQNQRYMVQSQLLNIGGTQFAKSEAREYLNKGDYANYRKHISEFRKIGDDVSDGLIARRKAEDDIFAKDLIKADEIIIKEESEVPVMSAAKKLLLADVKQKDSETKTLTQSGEAELRAMISNEPVSTYNDFNEITDEVELAKIFNVKLPSKDKNVTEPIKQYFNKKINDVTIWAAGDDKKISWDEYWKQSLGESTINLATKYYSDNVKGYDFEFPDLPDPKDTGALELWFQSITAIGLDFPVYAAGALLGAPSRSKFFSGFTAGFLNDSLKTTYLTALKENKVDGFEEWWNIFLKEGMRKGLESGFTLGTAMALPDAIGAKSLAAKYATQFLAFTGMGALFKGELPDAKEMTNTALVLLTFMGLEAGGSKTKKVLRNKIDMVFDRSIKTGKKPSEIIEEIATDPIMKQDLLSENLNKFREEVAPKEKVTVENEKPMGKEVINPETGEVTLTEVKPTEIVAQQKEVLKSPYNENFEVKFAEGEKGFVLSEIRKDSRTLAENKENLKKLEEIINDTLEIESASKSPNKANIEQQLLNKTAIEIETRRLDGEKVIEPITEAKPTEIVAQQKETGKPLVEEVAKEKAVEPVEKILEKIEDKELIERFEKLAELTSKAEKPQETITPEQQKMLEETGGSEAFSKARGYTEKEIADYKEYIEIAIEIDRRHGKDTAITIENDIQMANKQGTSIVSEELGNKSLITPEEVVVVDLNANSKAMQEVNSRIEFGKEDYKTTSLYTRAINNKNEIVRLMVDKLHPLRLLVNRYEKAGGKFDGIDPYVSQRIQPGNKGVGYSFIEHGVLDFTSRKRVSEPFKNILEDLKKINPEKDFISIDAKGKRKSLNKEDQGIEEFGTYLVAKRAVELEKRNIETGVNLKSSIKTVELLEPKYKALAERVYEYNNKVLKYLLDGDLINEKTYEAMLDANKNYVPFHRVMEENISLSDAQVGKGISNPLRKIKGSGLKIENPLDTIYLNTFHLTNIAERNASYVKLIKMVEQMPELFPEITKSNRVKAVNVSKEILNKVVTDPKHLTDKVAEGMTVFNKDGLIVSKNEIAVMRNGKREIWNIGEELATAFESMNKTEINMLMNFMSVPTKLLRPGATLDPGFMVKNFERDTFAAALFSDNNFIPMLNSFVGAFHLLKKGDMYKDWVQSGAMQSMFFSQDRHYFQRDLKQYRNRGKFVNIINPKNAIENLKLFGEIFESSTRLGEFALSLRAIRKKHPTWSERDVLQQGGFNSRDVSVDFSKSGSLIQAYNRITAFSNANIQGKMKIYDAFTKKPRATSIKVFNWVVVPTILLWVVNHDDERYKRLKPRDKHENWIFITGEGKDTKIFRYAKPFDIGPFVAGLTDSILTYLFDKDKKFSPLEALGYTKEILWEGIADTMAAQLPDMAKPLAENYFNHNLYTKRPVYGYKNEKKISPWAEATVHTSEVAKAIGSAMKSIKLGDLSLASPSKIDNIVRGWTGTLGRYALDAIDAALIASGQVLDPNKPTAKWGDSPILRAFVVSEPGSGSSYVVDFYKQYDRISTRLNTAQKLKNDGSFKEAVALLKEIYLSEDEAKELIGFNEGLTKMHSVVRNISLNKTMDPDKKREFIDRIHQAMIETSKVGLRIVQKRKFTTKEKLMQDITR